MFYTQVLRRYPFPEFPGEKFLTECVVWDKMAWDGLKLRFFNQVVYLCEYLPDGLTAHEAEMFRRNPMGHGRYLVQSAAFGKLTGLNKWNQFYSYYRQHRKNMPISHMAKNLGMRPLIFLLRMTGMNLFYKLYDR